MLTEAQIDQIHRRRDDGAMIRNRECWPQDTILPLKNYQQRDANGFPRLGYITSEDRLTIVFSNAFFPGDPSVEKQSFQSVDDMLAAGWIVD